jgi:Flp pilus assembly pilin Flp
MVKGRDPSAPSGRASLLDALTIEDGLTFVEILAAQREARRVVDGEAAGSGVGPWCEVSQYAESQPGVATPDDAVEADAERTHKPRIVGQGLIEYALVVVLIGIVVIVLLATVGHQAQDVFSNVSRGLAT